MGYLARLALIIGAAVLIVACGGSQPPIGAPGAMVQTDARTTRTDSSESRMMPQGKSGELLYVSATASSVYVYSYPDAEQVGSLTGFRYPGGLCVDRLQNIYITDGGTSRVLEYAHGGTIPIRSLSDPREYPIDCSIDPKTGDLAVANFYEIERGSQNGPGSLSIYKKAHGKPKTFRSDKFLAVRSCAYDKAGNAFINGFSRGTPKTRKVEVAELPRGGNALSSIELDKKLVYPAGIQWDGKYLAIGNGRNEIYRVQISGSSGQVLAAV